MTDEEIKRVFVTADGLLQKYVSVIHPVVEELAKRKSIAIFGKEGEYEGGLGDYEAGIDYINLHVKDSHNAIDNEEHQKKLNKWYEENSHLWDGLVRVIVGGYY